MDKKISPISNVKLNKPTNKQTLSNPSTCIQILVKYKSYQKNGHETGVGRGTSAGMAMAS